MAANTRHVRESTRLRVKKFMMKARISASMLVAIPGEPITFLTNYEATKPQAASRKPSMGILDEQNTEQVNDRL